MNKYHFKILSMPLLLSLSLLSGCGSSSSDDVAFSCPEEPTLGGTALYQTELVTIPQKNSSKNMAQKTVSGLVSYSQDVGYVFSAKAGQKLITSTQVKDICTAVFSYQDRILIGKPNDKNITIKKDDTYVVKVFSILNPEGQRLFNLDIKLLGGAKIAKLPYISEIPYYFQTIDGITESIRKEQYDKTEKYQTK
ncbi:hypothetical protein NIES3804_35930 [Microcystis aeruginosa NIES-3804]|uniref:Lipoprotein n=1 Tax=Microcystis aeruginosa NIES-3804 TaxID=2517783 RepID=A0A6H9GXI9_MICAE|nr:hypothetical protein [Microcystis aeruginosa]GCL52005.1 hypothetical protein NIES3804_35930 [Microcystis aeruginosa NIES-3804]